MAPDIWDEHRQIAWFVPPYLREQFVDIGCGTGNGVAQSGFQIEIGLSLSEFVEFDISKERKAVKLATRPPDFKQS